MPSGQQANVLQKVVDHHGPEHVEFEIVRRPTHPHRHIVAHDLSAHSMVMALHCVGLTFVGMMDEPGLVFRDGDLAQRLRGSGWPANAIIIGNLHQTDRQPL